MKCWAHARRKFKEAVDTQKSPLAKRVISLLKKVYGVERQIKGLTPLERAGKRHEHSLPMLQSIKAELMQYKDDAQGKVKTAIEYTLKAFESLQHFVFDGRLEIDNNPVERCIRGTALTKKNSLFAGSHDAAKVWAVYNTLIESAKLNRINPRKYLNWVAGEIEAAKGNLDYTRLMPWHCPVGRIDDLSKPKCSGPEGGLSALRDKQPESIRVPAKRRCEQAFRSRCHEHNAAHLQRGYRRDPQSVTPIWNGRPLTEMACQPALRRAASPGDTYDERIEPKALPDYWLLGWLGLS